MEANKDLIDFARNSATRLHRFLVYKKCPPDVADDLVQDALLSAHKNADSFRGESSYSTWMHRIAFNKYLNWIKQHRDKEGFTVDIDEALDIPGLADTEQEFIDARDTSALMDALERIEPLLAESLKLYVFEMLNYEQIAEKVNVPVGTVRSRIHRAKKALRARVEKPQARQPEVKMETLKPYSEIQLAKKRPLQKDTILAVLTAATAPLSATEIAGRAGISVPNVHTILSKLCLETVVARAHRRYVVAERKEQLSAIQPNLPQPKQVLKNPDLTDFGSTLSRLIEEVQDRIIFIDGSIAELQAEKEKLNRKLDALRQVQEIPA